MLGKIESAISAASDKINSWRENPYPALMHKLGVEQNISAPAEILRGLCRDYFKNQETHKILADRIIKAKDLAEMIQILNEELGGNPSKTTLKKNSHFHKLLSAFFSEYPTLLPQITFAEQLVIQPPTLQDMLETSIDSILREMEDGIKPDVIYLINSHDEKYLSEGIAKIDKAVAALVSIFPNLPPEQQASTAIRFFTLIVWKIYEFCWVSSNINIDSTLTEAGSLEKYRSPRYPLFANLARLINLFLEHLHKDQLKLHDEKSFYPIKLINYDVDFVTLLLRIMPSENRLDWLQPIPQKRILAADILKAINRWLAIHPSTTPAKTSDSAATDPAATDTKQSDALLDHYWVTHMRGSNTADKRYMLDRLRIRVLAEDKESFPDHGGISADNFTKTLNSLTAILSSMLKHREKGLNSLISGKSDTNPNVPNAVAYANKTWANALDFPLYAVIDACKRFAAFANTAAFEEISKNCFADRSTNPIKQIIYCFLLHRLGKPIETNDLLATRDILLGCLKPASNVYQKTFACIIFYLLAGAFKAIDLSDVITGIKNTHALACNTNANILAVPLARRALGQLANTLPPEQYLTFVQQTCAALIDVNLYDFLHELTQLIPDNKFLDGLLIQATNRFTYLAKLQASARNPHTYEPDAQKVFAVMGHVITHLATPDDAVFLVDKVRARIKDDKQFAALPAMWRHTLCATLFNARRDNLTNVFYDPLNEANYEALAEYLKSRDVATIVYGYAAFPLPKKYTAIVKAAGGSPIYTATTATGNIKADSKDAKAAEKEKLGDAAMPATAAAPANKK